jgi:lipooligosaccharide transport system permease protein
MAVVGPLSIVEYNVRAARRWWRSVVITGIGTPLLYMLALGVGLGVVIDDNGGAALGVPYLVFVAPAFLTAAALQIAAGDASYPVLGGFRWDRTYHGMAVTPLTPGQICDGVLLFIALRLTVNSTVYLAIMALFGATQSWWVLLCIPIATLTGLSFAAPLAALSAGIDNDGTAFATVFRFVVTPMFLFSGTFYPITELPGWAQALAWLSPLWHGTELARAAALPGGPGAAMLCVHLAYLLAWLVVGTLLAHWKFRTRLQLGAS